MSSVYFETVKEVLRTSPVYQASGWISIDLQMLD